MTWKAFALLFVSYSIWAVPAILILPDTWGAFGLIAPLAFLNGLAVVEAAP